MGFSSATVSVGGVTRQSEYQRVMDNTIYNRDTYATVSTYSTAWINRSDWTNVHLGTDDTKNVDSNLNHALDVPLSDLIVKVFISTDGTDANSFEITQSERATHYGVTVNAVDNNNILLQTGSSGITYLNSSGTVVGINSQDWYYKIKVYKLA